MKQALISLIAGLLFGIGLAVSGMADPARVTAFLDLAGDWDPALMFVMAGALSSYALCMYLSRKLLNSKGLNKCDLPEGESDPISRKLIIGTALFGIGWGLSGFCPGPAIPNLAALHTEALVFVPAMLVGMIASRVLAARHPDKVGGCKTDS